MIKDAYKKLNRQDAKCAKKNKENELLEGHIG